MASTLKNLQTELNFLNKSIEVEQKLVINKMKAVIGRMIKRGAGKEEIKKALNTPAMLIEWDRMKNNIRKLTASFINQVGNLGYYNGLKDG